MARKAAISLSVLVVLFAGLLMFAAKPPDQMTLTFAGFTTNGAGVETAHFDLNNEADHCNLEPQLLIVTDEEYASAAPKPPKGFMTSYMEKDAVTYYLAKSFATTNTPIQSSKGRVLKRGQTTVLSFPKPSGQGWRLMIDCWRTPSAKQSLGVKLADWNGWANRKFGLPVVFSKRAWMHLQLTTPAIPAKAIENGEFPDHLKRPAMFQP